MLRYAPAARPASLVEHYRRSGLTSDLTVTALLERNAAEFGPLPAVIDPARTLTWTELVGAALRFAGFLTGVGVGRGDVVCWQLPNWWESLVVAYGIWAAGAVSCPLTEISREHEVRALLDRVAPACVVTAEEFRGFGHAELWAEIVPTAGRNGPARVVVRGSAGGWTGFEEALGARPFADRATPPDDPALVVMTSGTTSGAKGVVHSTRSFLSYPLRTCRWVGAGWRDRTLSTFPLGHVSGMCWAVAVPLFTGGSVVIKDRWDPEFAVAAIEGMGVTYTGGPALFAREILDVVTARATDHLSLDKGFTCGASAFTDELAQAIEDIGLGANRAYGMSECPTVSGSAGFDPFEVRLGTDGRIAPGCEIRVVDDDGRPVRAGQVGEFVVRGPHRALGYLEAEHTAEGYDDQGWFTSGDLGTLSADGLVTVTGRRKDVINRGGEKISSRQVEDLLSLHPAVFEAAVVPAPHPRYGEEPAAFVLLRPGAQADGAELAAFLADRGLAAQKIPRVWRTVDDLPRTAAGKVKKYELAAVLAQPAAGD